MEISNQNSIKRFFHCSRCTQEMPDGESPSSWADLEVGWTVRGFQVWCKRHDCNVIHMDFEGERHPANDSATLALPKIEATILRVQRDELQRDCAEAYRVVGALAGDRFKSNSVQRALDNLGAATDGEPRPHDDLLPWPDDTKLPLPREGSND